jgi:hypothetical protein
LFSMWCCLFGDQGLVSELQGLPANWIAQHVACLVKVRQEYEAEHGLPPHPAVLVSLGRAAVARSERLRQQLVRL